MLNSTKLSRGSQEEEEPAELKEQLRTLSGLKQRLILLSEFQKGNASCCKQPAYFDPCQCHLVCCQESLHCEKPTHIVRDKLQMLRDELSDISRILDQAELDSRHRYYGQEYGSFRAQEIPEAGNAYKEQKNIFYKEQLQPTTFRPQEQRKASSLKPQAELGIAELIQIGYTLGSRGTQGLQKQAKQSGPFCIKCESEGLPAASAGYGQPGTAQPSGPIGAAQNLVTAQLPASNWGLQWLPGQFHSGYGQQQNLGLHPTVPGQFAYSQHQIGPAALNQLPAFYNDQSGLKQLYANQYRARQLPQPYPGQYTTSTGHFYDSRGWHLQQPEGVKIFSKSECEQDPYYYSQTAQAGHQRRQKSQYELIIEDEVSPKGKGKSKYYFSKLTNKGKSRIKLSQSKSSHKVRRFDQSEKAHKPRSTLEGLSEIREILLEKRLEEYRDQIRGLNQSLRRKDRDLKQLRGQISQTKLEQLRKV